MLWHVERLEDTGTGRVGTPAGELEGGQSWLCCCGNAADDKQRNEH